MGHSGAVLSVAAVAAFNSVLEIKANLKINMLKPAGRFAYAYFL